MKGLTVVNRMAYFAVLVVVSAAFFTIIGADAVGDSGQIIELAEYAVYFSAGLLPVFFFYLLYKSW